MTLRVDAKVLLHVWSYDFYDTTLSSDTSYHLPFVDVQKRTRLLEI